MTQDAIKIDHMAEAEKILEDLEPHRGQNLELDTQLAQVHATLELARQQRIANLIAYAALLDNQYAQANARGEADVSFIDEQADLTASLDRHDHAQRQIREGLGL